MNADIRQHESKPHPPFFLFCPVHLLYWPGVMVGDANESGSAPRGTYAQIFLRYRLSFFTGLPLGEPLPGIFAVSFIDNFPSIQSPFRDPQIPEIKELLAGGFAPWSPTRALPWTPGQISGFQFWQLSPMRLQYEWPWMEGQRSTLTFGTFL